MPHRWISTLGALALLAAASPAGATDMSVSPDRQAIEQIIHDYIMAHPEVVIESLKAGDARAKEQAAADTRAQIAKHKDELVHDTKSPEGGNPAGDVTIVEFFDYRCPYCKQVEPELEALLKEDGRIRVVYKEFPILGPESMIATRISLAALQQSPQKYARLHAALMSAKGQLSQDSVLKAAEAAGLDVGRIKTDMNGPEVDAHIKRNYDLAETLNIRGTPAFIVGNEMTPGAVDLPMFKKLVADARKAE
ncbi:MAG TPA: DsbA family protein [Stellaceae bacterium]|jgi:protein-disulfide isomerase|nr:DsbA family protein [Stellaceae bacterium]